MRLKFKTITQGIHRAAQLALLGLALATAATAATRIDLDAGWQFRIDPAATGETAGWSSTPPAGTRVVDLPHTWNVGPDHDYLGVAWYFRSFDLAPRAVGDHVELHFGATFYRSRIWLNGVELGGHEGGFTAYSFDITSHLRERNLLVVRLDNRPGAATIPGYGQRGAPDAWYDWWAYGGIVRDVWLSQTGPAWIIRQRIRSVLADDHAQVADRLVIGSGARTAARLRLTVYDPGGAVAVRRDVRATLASGSSELDASLDVPRPQRWSIDRPQLYRLEAELRDDRGRILDSQVDTFGLRTVEIRDRHLLLNGERVRLTGIARHEDSPGEGLAETRGTMLRDWDDLKALHTTLSRPVHYPQNPYILDYADRHGILLIPEIPVWQFSEAQLADPAVLALAQRQMTEMIEQAGNHPSIFAWSVANESATGTPGGIAYFRAMRDLIRRLDADRYVSFADDNLPKLERAQDSAANDADFLMMNQYFGSWHGPSSALPAALDRVDALFPGKMAIISEFGYAGVFASGPQEADRMRIRTLQEQIPVLAARDWIGGAMLWCYQDYRSRRNLWPGQTEGYVEHGLVDEERQRKPSYAIWRALNAPAQVQARWRLDRGGRTVGFTATVIPRSSADLPYRPLHDHQLSWELLDAKGKPVARGRRPVDDGAAAQSFDERFTDTASMDAAAGPWRLLLHVAGPDGGLDAEMALEAPPDAPPRP